MIGMYRPFWCKVDAIEVTLCRRWAIIGFVCPLRGTAAPNPNAAPPSAPRVQQAVWTEEHAPTKGGKLRSRWRIASTMSRRG
ncbi:hypothetical protein EDC02_5109 [Micromonospora sp. Llam0]|nr:hypothetical protein EDC02_5109 [Micromonospora sp. Llam0]